MRTTMKLKIISVKEIQPNPFQPRESFEKESLRELADSIKDAKILQPIIVRQHGFNYQIIAGERRWRAAQIAGLHKIPCIVKEIDEERVLIESLIENLHRKDLTDLERENAIHEIWENREDSGFQYKSELAKAIGVSPIRVEDDIEAWEARHEKGMPFSVSTRTIARTRGLEAEVRKGIVEKVAEGDLKASEVDVVAKKENQICLIECKYHNSPGIKSDIKTALYIHSRFLDIEKAYREKDNNNNIRFEAWLVTNTRCTSDALKYAGCVGLKVLAWYCPKIKNLQYFIETKKLYPISILSFKIC